MELVVTGQRYAVIVDKPPTDAKGKIIIPDTVEEPTIADIAPTSGVIELVGDGLEEAYPPGTRVHFVRFVGQALPFEDKVYLIIRDTDIIAVEYDNVVPESAEPVN